MTEPRLNGPWLNENLKKDLDHPNYEEFEDYLKSKAKLDKLD